MQTYTLITGASSGMGAVCAKKLSSTDNLILASENKTQLEKVRKECNYSDKHIIWCVDFAKERCKIAESLVDLLKEKNISINKYVHFAGITKILPIKNFPISYIDDIFNVNYFSIIEILRTLLKKNNNKALKNIVLISALVSIRGNIGNSIYASSKGAINSLVYSLAQELAPDININAVLPGAIMTPMTQNLNKEYLEEMKKETPLGFGTMEDVVNYVLFLLSDKSKWLTGQCLVIDGGRSTK